MTFAAPPSAKAYGIGLAIMLAKEAHEGQKYGDLPYFEGHVCQVVLKLYNSGIYDEYTIMAAYLHDVMEDNPKFSRRYLTGQGIPKEVLDTVELLTKKKHQCEFQYLMNLAEDARALDVKIADAECNSEAGDRPKYRVTVPMLRAIKAGELIYDKIN
jgi:(p)ppGpp synthase/HD superfamily hydrolase